MTDTTHEPDQPKQDTEMLDDHGLKQMLENALGDAGPGIFLWASPQQSADVQIERILEQRAEVVVLGPDHEEADALALIPQIEQRDATLSVVIMARRTTEFLQRAMRAGASGVIDPVALDGEIREVLADARQRTQLRRSQMHNELAPIEGTGHHVVPVLAAKGGAGKTTTATNVALALAEDHPNEVVLVDADVQFGDVSSTLGIEPTETMAGTISYGADLDITTLKAFLTAMDRANLFVLAAPDSPAQADDLSPAHFGRVLDLLKSEFTYVIVDTSAGIDEMTLEALDHATEIMVLSSMDVPSVRATNKELEALRMLGLERCPWHLVLNRANAKVGLTKEDVEESFGRPVDVTIPSSRSVPISVNQGEPIVLSDPRTPVARALKELATLVAGQETAEAKKSRWRGLR